MGAFESGAFDKGNGMNHNSDGGAVLSGIILFMGVILMMFMGLLDIWF
jgi:hypothetical protein